MASNPPFELEDQTDEDFFDKLVDDDDDAVNVTGAGLEIVGLPDLDEILDGDDSDEAKTFAKLSLNDGGGNVDDSSEVKAVEGNGTDSLGSLDLSSFEHGNVYEGGGMSSEPDLSLRKEDNHSGSSDVSLGERIVEANELPVVSGNVIQSSVSPGLFSFENGHVPNDGVVTSEAKSSLSSGSIGSGVKEVQWGNFSESGEHGKAGFGSYSDFFTNLGEGDAGDTQGDVKIGNEASKSTTAMESSFSYSEYQGESGIATDQTAIMEDVNSAQDWDNLYPGWKYDPMTAKWYQVEQENFDAASANVVYADSSYQASSLVQSSEASYAQQIAQSPLETVSQLSTSEAVSGWNHTSQENGEHQYPAHMYLDPQYPGWYYDTIAQEWRSLSDYHSSAQTTNRAHNQQVQNGSLLTTYYHNGETQGNSNALNAYPLSAHSIDHAHNQPFQNGSLSTADYYHSDSQNNSNTLKSHSGQALKQASATAFANYGQQGTNIHQSNAMTENRSWESSYDSNPYSNSHANQPKAFDSWDTRTSYEQTTQSDNSSNWVDRSQSFIPSGGAFQPFNPNLQGQQDEPIQYSTDYYGGNNAANSPGPFFANAQHHASGQSEGRSSAGRPPHALVTFGFGGKLVIMKDSMGGFSSYGSKDLDGRSISVCNLIEVVSVNSGPLATGTVTCSYFGSLCHQSFPGPLVGGNAGSKELNRWIDERVANCELTDMGYCESKALKLLLSLLKVACQHYGKLRSYGADTGLMESDLPESAVAKLFASAKSQFNQYTATSKCLTALPSEAQIQTTATEVQHLLISGRKKEALERAQEGQLWEFALILARQLGEHFYADTVKQMAITQLAVGSPLRTLCLLIAKKPEEVFSNNVMASDRMPENIHMPQLAENVGYSMLDNWEENLAVITANRTDNDHLVIIHLGDCLWKEKNDVTAAHICYLVAEADVESYSDSARLCLIGANHLSFPRTFASPEAIQRTEFYEYTKALGNSQFVLLPLQPYKLIYAHMLAEVGRVSDSLKYCQAIFKSLKTVRSQEPGTLKQLLTSLEDRIKAHQQSGYAAKLAPAKIMGKVLNFFDSTAHRVVGGLPPPAPSITQGSIQGNEHAFQTLGSKVPDNQSAVPSLTPSASMEPISQWAVDGSRMTLQNRSSSEPNIGRTPKSDQSDAENEATSTNKEVKQSGTTGTAGTSRFGRFNFGASILQKTVGLVLKPLQGNQAKLGDTNKFYYDEKLKRWVEEGVDAPAEEPVLAPPPTITSFANGMSDYNMSSAVYDQLPAANRSPEPSISTSPGTSPAIPTMPLSSNHFSARGRMGVRSRYVDTFNKGGASVASTNLFHPPTAPSAKPANAAHFFIPTASPSSEQSLGTESISHDESFGNGEISSMPLPMNNNDPFQNLTPSPAGNIQKFPSFDNISSNKATPVIGNNNSNNGSFASSAQSRRTSSWSDIHSNSFTPPPTTSEMKTSPLGFMPSSHSGAHLPMNRRNSGDDLQEVEL